MFLLSRKEATTYYTSTIQRQAIPTDYAKYQSSDSSYWWLRSPESNHGYIAYYVYDDGSIGIGGLGYNYGVRAACWINL